MKHSIKLFQSQKREEKSHFNHNFQAIAEVNQYPILVSLKITQFPQTALSMEQCNDGQTCDTGEVIVHENFKEIQMFHSHIWR